jgi:hypothetical protein
MRVKRSYHFAAVFTAGSRDGSDHVTVREAQHRRYHRRRCRYLEYQRPHRGMMGGSTPNIDRIAKEGALFTDYYAQQSARRGRTAFILGHCPFAPQPLHHQRALPGSGGVASCEGGHPAAAIRAFLRFRDACLFHEIGVCARRQSSPRADLQPRAKCPVKAKTQNKVTAAHRSTDGCIIFGDADATVFVVA